MRYSWFIKLCSAKLSFSVNLISDLYWTESALLLRKACCLFRIRSFKRCVIQGASRVFIRTFLTGIRRSRPVCITCSKTQRNSSQVSRELSNKGQSNEYSYLAISAFRLGCRSRLRTNLSGVVPGFLTRGATGKVLWSDRPKGGRCVVVIVQVS